LGIGTSSPATQVEIYNSTTLSGIRFSTSTATESQMTLLADLGSGYDNAGYIKAAKESTSNSYLAFGNKLSGSLGEKMRLTSAGFLGINCTPNYQFESAANTTNFAAMVRNSSSSTPNGLYVYFDNSSSANTTQAFLRCESTAGVKMVVYTDGNIKIPVGSTYGVFSDAKLKTNVVDVSPKLDDLLKLKVRNFGSLEKPDEKYVGFIAQEFEEVFPSLVTISKDTIKNENGEDEENGEITKGIKESALIPILVKAIQELQEQINELKNK
jgi:hypothetical protein